MGSGDAANPNPAESLSSPSSSSSSIHSFSPPHLPTFHATACAPGSSSTIPFDPYRSSSASPRPSQVVPSVDAPNNLSRPCSPPRLEYAADLDPFSTCLRFSRRRPGRKKKAPCLLFLAWRSAGEIQSGIGNAGRSRVRFTASSVPL
jgi:hypothetical protein